VHSNPDEIVQPRAATRWLALVPDAVAVAVALLLLWTIAWVGGAVPSLLRQHGEQLATYAVLRAGMSESQGGTVGEQLQAQVPGLLVRVIGEAEARGLLALQEPWTRNLPDMELARLPLMIDIRHPELLDRPELQTQITQLLDASPEVEFSIFNENGFDSLVAFSRTTSGYATWLRRVLMAGVLALAALYGIRVGLAAVRAPMVGLLGRLVLAVFLGAGAAALLMPVLRAQAGSQYALPPLAMSTLFAQVAWAAGALLLGGVFARLVPRKRSR